MKIIGLRFVKEYNGSLEFQSEYTRLPSDRITAPPKFIPREAHEICSGRNEQKYIISNEQDSLEHVTKIGCSHVLLKGLCADPDCPYSHEDIDLEERCSEMVKILQASKYFKKNDEESLKVSKKRKEVSDERLTFNNEKEDSNEEKEQTCRGKKKKKSCYYDDFKRETESPSVYIPLEEIQNEMNKREIPESDVLTQDTWTSLMRILPKGSHLLMVGSPHKAEVQYLQNHFILQVLEYRLSKPHLSSYIVNNLLEQTI